MTKMEILNKIGELTKHLKTLDDRENNIVAIAIAKEIRELTTKLSSAI